MSKTTKTIAALAVITALTGLAGPALASCKNQICVHGRDDDRVMMHYVEVSSQRPGYNVFYVMLPDLVHTDIPTRGPVKLSVPQFQFPIKAERPYAFAVQACSSRGRGCIGWTQFTHTLKANW
jgi:hypothetical protein